MVKSNRLKWPLAKDPRAQVRYYILCIHSGMQSYLGDFPGPLNRAQDCSNGALVLSKGSSGWAAPCEGLEEMPTEGMEDQHKIARTAHCAHAQVRRLNQDTIASVSLYSMALVLLFVKSDPMLDA